MIYILIFYLFTRSNVHLAVICQYESEVMKIYVGNQMESAFEKEFLRP